jgi:hypothetical protein
MNRNRMILIALLAVTVLGLYLLWPTDERRIRKLFNEGALAFEQGKADEVMAKVSFNFNEEHGVSYILLKNGLTRLFQQLKDITVEYEITSVIIKDDQADAELDIRMVATRGTDTGYFVGDAAKPLHLKFHLEKQRTTWLVTGTSGLPAGL